MGCLPLLSPKVEDEMELEKGKRVRFYVEKESQGTSGKQRAINFKKNANEKPEVFPEDHDVWCKGMLDPGGDMLLKWNRVFILACLLALFVDPLYFYLPSVHDGYSSGTFCTRVDKNLNIAVTTFRTMADLFYVLHIAVKFRTAYVAPSSRVFGRGELVTDERKIARRYLRSDFFVDLLAALPLPQVVIWIIIPAIKSADVDSHNDALALIVLLQYIPRLYLIFPLSSQIIKATGVVTVTAWAGAAYNLLLYMLASHVLGASWYLLSIARQTACWKLECRREMAAQTLGKCHSRYLDCVLSTTMEARVWANGTGVFRKCNATDDHISFRYGIFGDALANGVVRTNFIEKFLYCLWWGLQSLSSYGQNLATTAFFGETAFAILIAIMGLVLFAHLIGNMQTYLQSVTLRLEEWRLKRRDTEEWMRHRQLPDYLQDKVRKFVQYKWLTTRGVNEESILQTLPTDLRRDIQRHLCLDLVRRVPFFSQMDGQLLDAICERLVSSLSTAGTYIVREGDPVTEMLFIIRGKLESSTTNGGRTGFFNTITLNPGDFCGEELLTWALVPNASVNLPSSTRTVLALAEVEGFALRSNDLRFVANQFRRLHSKKLQHTFRFYSHHWRTWAACFIQAAWRRFKRRKLARELNKQESFSSFTSDDQETSPEREADYLCSCPVMNPVHSSQNVGVAILASRFAANTRRPAQKAKGARISKLPKPEEPDFSTDHAEE